MKVDDHEMMGEVNYMPICDVLFWNRAYLKVAIGLGVRKDGEELICCAIG